ncbi:MAG: Gfo/Idh/MocA family protein [Bacteriovoracaceae bacterium]
MKKVKVAVIGYGHLGKWHCQKVAAHAEMAEFVAIVEKFPAGQEIAKANHPGVKVVSEISEIINEIDAAFIVTPTSTHFSLCRYLLENNKHIFCEKPVCSNDEEAAQLAEFAKNKKMVFQVGHSERCHEAWEKLAEELSQVHRPYTIRINRVAAFKGRATDVDVVQDLAIHDLDLLTYILKFNPVSVRADGYKIRTDKWDHATMELTDAVGSVAYITVGRNHVKEIRDVEITSKSGMIYVDLFTNKYAISPSGQYAEGVFVKEDNYAKRDHLLVEHGHFYQSILNGTPVFVNLNDGLKAVHLVDTVLKALETKKTVQV